MVVEVTTALPPGRVEQDVDELLRGSPVEAAISFSETFPLG
jgi:hypothetical protein